MDIVAKDRVSTSVDKHIDLFETTFVVTNYHRMAMVTKMNVCPLHCIISVDVKDTWIACCHIYGGLIADLADKTGSMRRRSFN